MRARWLLLLVVMVGAAPAHAEPDGTCAAACQRLAQCKLSKVDACTRDCKRSAAESTPEGRAQLVALVRASCDQLAAAAKAQPQPAPRTPAAAQAPRAPQAPPAPQAQSGRETQPAPQPHPTARAQPAPPAPPGPQPTPGSDRQVWKCTSEGSYEILRKGEIYWRPAGSSAFGFGKTQQLAILQANASCGQHMSSMMAIEGITSQTRLKTLCRPIRCTPPP